MEMSDKCMAMSPKGARGKHSIWSLFIRVIVDTEGDNEIGRPAHEGRFLLV